MKRWQNLQKQTQSIYRAEKQLYVFAAVIPPAPPIPLGALSADAPGLHPTGKLLFIFMMFCATAARSAAISHTAVGAPNIDSDIVSKLERVFINGASCDGFKRIRSPQRVATLVVYLIRPTRFQCWYY